MPRKIDAGELLAALGGLLVLIALFLEWYSIRDAELLGSGASGWEAFESLDLIIAALALTAIAVAASTFGAGWPLSPRALVPVGALLVLIIAIQLAEPPPVVSEFDPDTGAWLALGGALLVLLGGLLRVSSISVTVSTSGRETRQRVAAVDRRESRTAPAATAEPARRRSLLDDEPPPAPAASSPLADPQATQPFRPVDEDK